MSSIDNSIIAEIAHKKHKCIVCKKIWLRDRMELKCVITVDNVYLLGYICPQCEDRVERRVVDRIYEEYRLKVLSTELP